MSIAFAVGNGISRRGVSLQHLLTLGPVYGCNAVFQEFTPTVLVATDRPIATRIQESGYSIKNRFYTRRPIDGLGASVIPHPYFGFSSGPATTAIAALDQNQRIYMLGFDMGPAENKTFNNVYAGTEFYKSVGSAPTYTGNWVKQIVKIAQDFPQVTFERVIGSTTAHIPEFESVKNIQHIPMSTFVSRINTQKDL
jgi:hypothetical protein